MARSNQKLARRLWPGTEAKARRTLREKKERRNATELPMSDNVICTYGSAMSRINIMNGDHPDWGQITELRPARFRPEEAVGLR
jgi:hypothetical protein